MKKARILFWPDTGNLSVASYRIRCRNVVNGLREINVEAGYYNGKIKRHLGALPDLRPPSILILSKRTKYSALEWAVELKKRYGTKLILDVCDHIFFEKKNTSASVSDEREIRSIRALNQFDAVVTPSAFLRDTLATRLRDDMRFEIILDAVETDPTAGLIRAWRERDAFAQLRELEQYQNRSTVASGRRLVWFGSHGMASPQNGMHDMATFSEILEKHNDEEKLSLTIISNNREKYRSLFGDRKFETVYQEWNYYTINQSLRLHDIALIPVRTNDYNLAKSANRLTTAFNNNLAVCASSIGSYEPFRKSAIFDDWEDGLRTLMESSAERGRRIELGQKLISQKYTQQAISYEWKRLLDGFI